MKTAVAVGVITLAIVFHALFPRYEWRDVRGVPLARIDRWTGRLEIGQYNNGVWVQRLPAQPTASKKDPLEELRELVDGK